MIDFSAPAKEIFEILKSCGYIQVMYDIDGNRTDDPGDARRFFVKKENLLVSLSEDEENSCVKLYKGNKSPIGDLLNLIKTLRTTSSKYKLLFHTREYGKEISPKDFSNLQETRKKGNEMNIFEGMYGTMSTSYLKLENAKMTVKHSKKTDNPKERAKCIESIILEDGNGETFTFPTNNLMPAKAMAQHMNHGGNFADVVGQQINRMAQDYSSLVGAVNHISGIEGSAEPQALMTVQEACRSQVKKMFETFVKLALAESYNDEKFSIVTLNESEKKKGKTPEETLDEMSDLLMSEGKHCSRKIVEAACDAMTKEGKKLELKEKEEKPNLISVFGKKIDKTVWENFKHGVMQLVGQPDFNDKPQFLSKTAELMYKVSKIVPHIENDALQNLVNAIAEKTQEVKNPELKKQFLAVGMKTLKNAGVSLDEGVKVKSKAIMEYQKWIDSFDIKKVLNESKNDMEERDLNEGDEDSYVSVMGNKLKKSVWDNFKHGVINLEGKPSFTDIPKFLNKTAKMVYELSALVPHIADDSLSNLLGTVAEKLPEEKDEDMLMKLRAIASKAVKSAGVEAVTEDYALLDEMDDDLEFSPIAWWNSRARKTSYGIGLGTQSLGGMEDKVSRDEVKDSLIEYFSEDENQMNPEELAEEYLQQTIDYLHGKGFEITDDDDVNSPELVDEDDDVISREDIIFPDENQEDSFKSEVLSKTVSDPITGDEEDVGGNYLGRLRTLSGLTAQNSFDNGGY